LITKTNKKTGHKYQQGRIGRCGNTAIATRLFKNDWHFKDIFKEIGAFVKV
jgi:hypothetical protein